LRPLPKTATAHVVLTNPINYIVVRDSCCYERVLLTRIILDSFLEKKISEFEINWSPVLLIVSDKNPKIFVKLIQ
jgi:hypothetical protein